MPLISAGPTCARRPAWVIPSVSCNDTNRLHQDIAACPAAVGDDAACGMRAVAA